MTMTSAATSMNVADRSRSFGSTRATCIAIVLAGLVAGERAAHAQGENADALFKEGRALLDQKKYDEACPKLAESQRIEPGAGTLLALALCHEGQGKTATAKRELEEAAALGRKNGREDLAKAAQKRAAAMEPTLSKLVIRMPQTEDAERYDVRCDGAAIAPADRGTPLAVDPGEHKVEVSAKGKVARSYVVRLSGAGSIEIVVDKLEDAAVAKHESKPKAEMNVLTTEPPPADGEASSSGTGQKIIGWSLVAIGVGGLGTGAYFGGRALSQQAEGRRAEGAEAHDANDRAKDSFKVSVMSVAGGTAALAVGIIMLITAPSTPAKKSASMTRIVPNGGPMGGGLDLVGTF
jgi:tetratricopeptide (TPR) repeat protein